MYLVLASQGLTSHFKTGHAKFDLLYIALNTKYLLKGSTVGSAAKALGFMGMWQGLGPRIIMIGTLTALQWFIYDGVKVALALPRYDLSV